MPLALNGFLPAFGLAGRSPGLARLVRRAGSLRRSRADPLGDLRRRLGRSLDPLGEQLIDAIAVEPGVLHAPGVEAERSVQPRNGREPHAERFQFLDQGDKIRLEHFAPLYADAAPPTWAGYPASGRSLGCATELLGGPDKPSGVVYAPGLLTREVAGVNRVP